MRPALLIFLAVSISWAKPPGPPPGGGPPPQGGQQGGGPPPGPGQSSPQQNYNFVPPPPQQQSGPSVIVEQSAPRQIIYQQEEPRPETPKGPPGKAKMTEFKDTFATMVEEYVDAHTRGGLFVVKPENSEAMLRLTSDGIRPKAVTKRPDGLATGSVEFQMDGSVVLLDFHAQNDGWEWKVTRVLLHKLGAKNYLAAGDPAPKAKARPAEPVEAEKPEAAEAAPKAPPALLEVDLPPKTKVPVDPEAYAVVVGIEKYRDVPKVDFAARDAQTVFDYLTKSMGFDPKNVALLQNDRAGLADLETYLGPWLADRVTAKSRVMIYYAGHGAPNATTGEGYLIPYDGNPTYVETKAFPIKKLYQNLAKLPSKDVSVVLDSCFSGAGGRSVLARGARPLVLMKDSAAPELGANTTVLTAARGDQISTFNEEGRHGLLTYYLLKGLRGEADGKKDGKITMQELFDYVGPAVERAARLQHVDQTPTVLPDSKSLGERGRRVWIRTR